MPEMGAPTPSFMLAMPSRSHALRQFCKSLYLHREDAVQGIRKNGVWIELHPPQIQLARRLNNGYVKIEGIFSASDHGHFGLWSGSINDVKIISGRVPLPSKKKKNLMRMK
ncbi:hypothetical protein F2P44_33835 [Massilia sp. CCM 8695]|uniref:Transposase n=2 Tax=Massilia frigida TaxID=2609281 RepID=A0ABX0NKP2_9BURK|nr:hypothetical protein [Massilia frigida]